MNYYERYTSNYFKVKDLDKFKEVIKEKNIEEIFQYKDNTVCVVCDDFYSYNDETDEEFTCDEIAELIRENMTLDSRLYIDSIGYEGYRYFTAGVWRIMPYRVEYNDLFRDYYKDKKASELKW